MIIAKSHKEEEEEKPTKGMKYGVILPSDIREYYGKEVPVIKDYMEDGEDDDSPWKGKISGYFFGDLACVSDTFGELKEKVLKIIKRKERSLDVKLLVGNIKDCIEDKSDKAMVEWVESWKAENAIDATKDKRGKRRELPPPL